MKGQFPIFKDGICGYVMLETPDAVKNGDYEISYQWVPTCSPGRLPESAEEYSLEYLVVLNMHSKRLQSEKFKVLEEIFDTTKAAGCAKAPLHIMNDFWDASGARVVTREPKV